MAIGTIGAIGHYWDTVLSDFHYRNYRGGDMLLHYRTLSELSELSELLDSIELCYRNYRTSAHVRQLFNLKDEGK